MDARFGEVVIYDLDAHAFLDGTGKRLTFWFSGVIRELQNLDVKSANFNFCDIDFFSRTDIRQYRAVISGILPDDRPGVIWDCAIYGSDNQDKAVASITAEIEF